MKKNKILLLFSMFIILVVTGCSSVQKSTDQYKYGVIYSSMFDGSSIYTYNGNGEFISNKKLDVGGITLASFMKLGINTGDYVYYACPIYKNKETDYILQLNTKSLESTKVKSDGPPTFFCVDDKFAYTANTTLKTTYVSKSDLDKKNILKSTQIESNGMFMLEDAKNIYVIGAINNDKNLETDGKIHILDKATLKVSRTIDLLDLSFVTDGQIIDNNMYLLLNRDGKDILSKNLIKVDLKKLSVENIELPFDNLYRLHYYDNYMYVVESELHGDETDNRIAKIDLKTMNINLFNCKNNHQTTYIIKNEFISSDGNKIFIYDTKNFNLKNQFEIKKVKDQNFVSFYIKE